ncbi:hypothetical protein Ccar_24360 [Clostridium carboxidivorans P7]|uniref:Phage-associated protein n=1 Tax=Clostridium carboxidivorans P7 TaxID=536227 RepID=C6PV64_9CLOT|nr:DUF2815 family protein [Clostridium carboxidivorans]AKN33788.1 hypothetical protein Ccar_24360 [Clostridium carboxidivorans P7]EET86882.1 conserved hypothetical protein [Clostridium carboxidivorans P7]EFG86603.1 hypothetical protein CLCAR_3550 [Clostridium carboxidivorans P7]
MKVITGKVRFSYANVWEPKSINGGDPKYSVSLIIPKADKVTINKVKEAIESAKKEGISKLGGSIPDNLKMPLRDGDVDRAEEEAYKDSYFINANSSTKPGIVDKNVQTITDKSEFYSGCYGRASITFYAYNVDGNKGIACGLENLQKLEDGEALGGHSRAEDDFDAAADNFLD